MPFDAARTRPTKADVARLANVSTATVSYVLNNVEGQTISPFWKNVRHGNGFLPLTKNAPLPPTLHSPKNAIDKSHQRKERNKHGSDIQRHVQAIAGAAREKVGAVVLGRGMFPSRYFTHFSLRRRLESEARRVLGQERHKDMARECVRFHRSDSMAMFDAARFVEDFGFEPGTDLAFFNHHLAHALPSLFHTDWSEGLLYTADGGGDHVQYSIRIFREGRLETLYGGDEALSAPARIDSLGLAYGFATQALGFQINRHEGKLTGLAAYGRPVLYERLAARFRVDEEGQIFSDFENNMAMRRFIFEAADGVSREDVAASVQHLLETFVLEAVGRGMWAQPHPDSVDGLRRVLLEIEGQLEA